MQRGSYRFTLQGISKNSEHVSLKFLVNNKQYWNLIIPVTELNMLNSSASLLNYVQSKYHPSSSITDVPTWLNDLIGKDL